MKITAEQLIEKLHAQFKMLNFTTIRSLEDKDADPLIVVSSNSTNHLLFSFNFDGEMIYAASYGNVSVYTLSAIYDAISVILEGNK